MSKYADDQLIIRGFEVAIENSTTEPRSHRDETREDMKAPRSDVNEIKSDATDLRLDVSQIKTQQEV